MSDPPILYLDTELRPYRSMSNAALAVILGLMVAYNGALAAVMMAIGAFPVPVFLGLDVAGVTIAFIVSSRGARNGERVQVTHAEVRVTRRDGAVSRTLWTSPTAFTRVDVQSTKEGVSRVSLRLSSRSFVLGQRLGPLELGQFAERLTHAMRRALAERHP